MDMIKSVIEWVVGHPVEVLGVLGGLHAIAKVIVKLTPTEVDNKILAVLTKIVLSLVKVAGLQPDEKK